MPSEQILDAFMAQNKYVSEVDLYLKSLLILDTVTLITSDKRVTDRMTSSLKLLTLDNMCYSVTHLDQVSKV